MNTKDFLKKVYKQLVKQYGYSKNNLFIFEYCSNYGIELDNSTIDEIEICGDEVLFIFNSNERGNYAHLERFSEHKLMEFYVKLVNAIEEEKKYEEEE